MKGGLRFSFKMPDIKSFGKKLIRSAQDIKTKATTFFRPRKPIDISVKAKQDAEIKKMKEEQAVRVAEGEITKVEAQKAVVNNLMRQPSFLERLRGFF